MKYGGTSVLTRAGQVTLPKTLRAALALERGEHIAFYFDSEEKVVVLRPKQAPLELFEKLAAKARDQWPAKGLTREEVVAEVKQVRAAKTSEKNQTGQSSKTLIKTQS